MSPESHEYLPTPIIDPTAAGIPLWVAQGYTSMNESIAANRATEQTQSRHLIRSRAAISATAQEALRRAPSGEERTALILGPGGCFDIPVEEIVSEFDRTTFLDVDTTHTERALSSLPANLLGKVSLVKADVSGQVTRVSNIFEKAGTLSANYPNFIKNVSRELKKLTNQPTPTPIKGKYMFVSSQLLMSQICSLPYGQFAEYVQEKYGQPLSPSISTEPGALDAPLTGAMNMYTMATQTAHIQHLARLVADTGTVHFADTAGIMIAGQPQLMTHPHVLREIGKHFIDIVPMAEWLWKATPNLPFYVIARSLAPKQNPTIFQK